MARVPADSEPVGLSTVPRRRIVVGGDPKVGSSNPPRDEEVPAPRAPASSQGSGEKRSSAPAHLKSRREKLSGTGYSEVPPRAEERVAPSAIPRAPRVPQIDGDRGRVNEAPGKTAVGVLGSAARRSADEQDRSATSGSAGSGSAGSGSAGSGGAGSGNAGSGSAGSGSPSPLDAVGSEPRPQPTSFRRSDTARSVANPVLPEMPPSDWNPDEAVSSGPGVRGGFDDMPPATDANFPPAYSPSGTLQSMSAVRPELSTGPSQAKFTRTLTGAGFSARQREALEQAAKDSERYPSSIPSDSSGFGSERTMRGLPRVSGLESPRVPLRPSPPPVVLSDPAAESLLQAIAEAAQGQLRESEMPVPSERLEAEVLQQLGQLDEALKSSPRVPTFDRPPSDRAPGNRTLLGGPMNLLDEHQDSEPAERMESSPGSSIDAPSPGSVPSQSALPGEGPMLGPGGLPTVGRYEVLARLKSGGMGSVYMCRLSGNAGFRRLFAMKVLHAHLNRDKEALESFQREARVLAFVHHPNVVGVVDFGSEREPYIVLEYVEGGSLHELFRATTGGRDPRLLLTVVLDVLEGLAAAHGANDDEGAPLGLVHCDVCPQNILVGVDGTARLTDFGIAQTEESRLHPEQLRGKPRYLAPERTTTDNVDARVDLFSLGVVLYAGLTGVEPFAGETAEETRWNVSNKAVPAPSSVGFRPPPALDWLCLKALAKDPAGRFQSAEEMASQLRRIAEREGLLASRSELAEWVRMTLAPSLAARRVASRRGTVTGGGRLGSIAPPDVRPFDAGASALPSKAPPAPPSAAEHTAPLSSQHDFSENTEILSGDAARRVRSKRVLYGMVAICMGILLWGMLAPDSLAKLFAIEDRKEPTPEADQPAKEDPAGAIVPEIGNSFGESAEPPEDPAP